MNDLQKKKKKNISVEDYALIFGIISFATFIPQVVDFKCKYDVLLLFVFLGGIFLGFGSALLGIIGFIKSIASKQDYRSYIKSILGVLPMVIYLLTSNVLIRNKGVPQSEGKQNLGAIYTAYTSYHSDNNTYPSAPFITLQGATFNCLAIADWEPKGSIRYNYNCMNTEAFSPPVNDSPCPPGIVTSATKDSFTIAACGNVDNDTTIDVWTIDDAKHLKNIIDDVKN